MAQRDFNSELAGKIWSNITLSTSYHRLYPKLHKGSVLMVGYADITIHVAGVPVVSLPGNALKIIGGNLHFDPKSEKARDGSDRYFSVWFPCSAEARAAITEHLKADPKIAEMCQQAVASTGEASVPMPAFR